MTIFSGAALIAKLLDRKHLRQAAPDSGQPVAIQQFKKMHCTVQCSVAPCGLVQMGGRMKYEPIGTEASADSSRLHAGVKRFEDVMGASASAFIDHF
jgi:hypothetical protein